MPEQPMTQRDVEALRTTLDKLDRTVENLPRDIAGIYVRKDVLAPTLVAINESLAAVREKVDTHSKHWTWLVQTVVGFIIVAVLTAAFTLYGLRGR